MNIANTSFKQKIVIVPSPSGKLGFCAWDYETFEPFEEIGWMPTIQECVNKLSDQFEIMGFLSHEVIIPLVGLIPGHEDRNIEDATERLFEAAGKQGREMSS